MSIVATRYGSAFADVRERVGDCAGDIGLQGEYVPQISLVTVAPQVSLHAGLNEFNVDPYAIGGA